MIAASDLEHCREVIRTGSYSFHAASKLLPSDVRDPALALYAFCRLADDEVDEGDHKRRAVLSLQNRLDSIYAGTPKDAPEDRAFAAGRIYLPLEWFEEAGMDVEEFLANPTPRPEIRRMTARLLAEAHRLYIRSEAGVPALPMNSRMGIYAARFDGIGKQVRRLGFDSITQRARTTKLQKLGWMGQAILRSGVSMITPQSPVLHAKPLSEVAFLVDAASRNTRPIGRTAALLDVLAQLQQREAEVEHRSSRA